MIATTTSPSTTTTMNIDTTTTSWMDDLNSHIAKQQSIDELTTLRQAEADAERVAIVKELKCLENQLQSSLYSVQRMKAAKAALKSNCMLQSNTYTTIQNYIASLGRRTAAVLGLGSRGDGGVCSVGGEGGVHVHEGTIDGAIDEDDIGGIGSGSGAGAGAVSVSSAGADAVSSGGDEKNETSGDDCYYNYYGDPEPDLSQVQSGTTIESLQIHTRLMEQKMILDHTQCLQHAQDQVDCEKKNIQTLRSSHRNLALRSTAQAQELESLQASVAPMRYAIQQLDASILALNMKLEMVNNGEPQGQPILPSSSLLHTFSLVKIKQMNKNMEKDIGIVQKTCNKLENTLRSQRNRMS